MTIRFTLAEKWQDKWFRTLTPAEKLLFLYICDNCNIAGIWEVDLELASYFTGFSLDEIQGAFKGLSRGYELLNNEHLWLKNFLKHQRNFPLNPNNLAHASIINSLFLYKDLSENILGLLSTDEIQGATKGLSSPISISKGISKGISKSKSKSKSKEKISEINTIFEVARKLYPGTKGGGKIEFNNFKKKHKDWKEVLPLLKPAIESQIEWRKNANGSFRPPWRNFSTWINQRTWGYELDEQTVQQIGADSSEAMADYIANGGK